MTTDQVIEALFAAVLAAVSTAVGWLVSSVIKLRERGPVVDEKLKVVETKMETHIAVCHPRMEAHAVTQECVREAIDEALDKRDETAEKRRLEWDKRSLLEVRVAFSEEFEKVMPRILREVRNATGTFMKPPA